MTYRSDGNFKAKNFAIGEGMTLAIKRFKDSFARINEVCLLLALVFVYLQSFRILIAVIYVSSMPLNLIFNTLKNSFFV